jgi:hypothetical protein
MPTAICENDAAEKDKIMIASNNHRTAALFRFIPILPACAPKTLNPLHLETPLCRKKQRLA